MVSGYREKSIATIISKSVEILVLFMYLEDPIIKGM